MSNTYTYNLQSGLYLEEDFGSISSGPTDEEDYENITSTENGLVDDWGSITTSEDQPVFGSISTLDTSQESTAYQYISSGLLFEFTTETLTENVTFTWIGNGTLFEIGNGLERTMKPYVSSGTLRISDLSTSANREIQVYGYYGDDKDPGTSGSLVITNTPLVHPNIDYTPHYGIEQNIGIGTTGIQLSGVSVNYSNVYPGTGGGLPDNAGIGTIRINDENELTRYRPIINQPFFGSGSITVIGNGLENYSRTTYLGVGLYEFGGISSNQKVQVYGYYGDDKDPGTSGSLVIPNISLIEKSIKSYNSILDINIIGEASNVTPTYSYTGSGEISKLSGASESISNKVPSNTVLYELFGNSDNSKQVTYIVSGNVGLFNFIGELEEKTTKSYFGDGSILLNGTAEERISLNPPPKANIRFVTHTSDVIIDTCDSEEVTCDNVHSADISFVSNPVENTQLFIISGDTFTSKVSNYEFLGIGTQFISGGYTEIKFISQAKPNTVLFNFYESSHNSKSTVKVGFGGLLSYNGSAQSFVINPSSGTILYTISGIAITRPEKTFENVGIGLFDVYDSATTRKISSYVQSGIGNINIFGELVHPNIKFIPTPKVSGSFNISGSSSNSVSIPILGNGSFFAISSGLESFTYPNYVGVGTIFIIPIFSNNSTNPFQIPRTYSIII